MRFSLAQTSMVALAVWLTATSAPAQTQVDFSRDVRPILAKRCFHCHGPSDSEAGLRLDDATSIRSELDSGAHAVVPGKPEASELIARVSADDESIRMPPEGKPLTEREVDILRRWIAAGAPWEQHWAFQPMTNPEVPAVNDAAWVKTPIDAFIRHKLEQRGLRPSERASKLSLLRRAYFDLIGLPPSAAEIESFLADDSPDAFEKVVDRLLESEHYGEKWARHWLDVVRFAETNSFERDGRKPHAWRFRDYVIRSFNADKGYDRFLREQLAGDEFPDPTPDDIIATGYYRLGLWDDEPADRLLAKFDGLDDIVTTTGQVFLGLTINCARCHDHKIDPIPQADYYSMVAFFHGITPMVTDGPNISRPIFESPEDRQRYDRDVAELEAQRGQVQVKIREIEDEFRGKLDTRALGNTSQPDLIELESRFYRDSWDKLPNFDELKPETVAKVDPPYFDIRSATREDSFGFVFVGTLLVPADGEYTFTLDSDDGSRLSLDGKELLLYDGVHGVGKPVTKSIELKVGTVPIRLDYFQGIGGKGLSLVWSGPGFQNRFLSAATADGTPTTQLKGKPIPELIHSLGAGVLGADRFAEYEQLKKEREQLFRRQIPAQFALCVTENPNPPDTFIMRRGSPQNPGELVEPAFPSVLTADRPEIPPVPAGATTAGRRTVLADWIASPDNPLTARVIVNRVWQHHFGRGIVRSSNNFGLLGDPPTHPELLDWLARDFIAGGWKFKRLHKQILMSNAWQQSSAPNPAAFEQDPRNDLFWKFDPRRMNAEEIRDALYVATGEFNPKMYGPGMYPDIPPEVLAGQSQPGSGWGKSPPEEQSRRSIYIHVKRSLITPLLADFDFCDTDTSCAARFSTVQPTQALGLLNGEFMQQRARAFSARIRREAGDGVDRAASQVERSILFALHRPATDDEIERGVTLLAKLRDEHALTHEAALDLYCLLVLNLNEFLYLD